MNTCQPNQWAKQLVWVASVWLVCLLLPDPALSQRRRPEVYGTFDGDAMYTVIPANRIPAIFEPQFVSREEAAAQMSPQELVLGVVIDGEARAYSLWQLDAHEIVNDKIGKTAFAVTW